MKNVAVCFLALVLLSGCTTPVRAGFGDFVSGVVDTVGNAVGNAADAVSNVAQEGAGAVADVATGGWDKVSGWSEEAWSTVKDTVVNAYTATECTVVDWVGIDFDACWQAPPSDPCTDACKASVDKLPQNCLDRIMTDVQETGNPSAIQRLEQQITACGKTFTILEGGAGPIIDSAPFDAANPACASANWTDINFPACNTILEDDAADSACPAECEEALGKVPTPCVDALVADLQVAANVTMAEEMLATLCLLNATATA